MSENTQDFKELADNLNEVVQAQREVTEDLLKKHDALDVAKLTRIDEAVEKTAETINELKLANDGREKFETEIKQQMAEMAAARLEPVDDKNKKSKG